MLRPPRLPPAGARPDCQSRPEPLEPSPTSIMGVVRHESDAIAVTLQLVRFLLSRGVESPGQELERFQRQERGRVHPDVVAGYVPSSWLCLLRVQETRATDVQ